MADISDVQTALVKLVDGAVFPNGEGQPSVTGKLTSIYPGWPASSALTSALTSGNVHVSVYARNDERNTTRYPQDAQVIVPPAPTLTATIAGQTITLGGTVALPQNVALLVSGQPYVYAVQAGDTLATIAASLASLVAAAITGTTSTGPVITVGAIGRIQAARVGAAGTVGTELRRQGRVFQITVWASTPSDRDVTAAAIDRVLAAARRITLSDGFSAKLTYRGSPQTDALQKDELYRRDINYAVEYATTLVEQVMAVTSPSITLDSSADGSQVATYNL